MDNSKALIPLIVVLVYIAILMVISIVVSRKQKKDGEAFLLYKGKSKILHGHLEL